MDKEGAFANAARCAAAIFENGCEYFQFSTANGNRGCRCCASVNSHQHSNDYTIHRIQPNLPAFLKSADVKVCTLQCQSGYIIDPENSEKCLQGNTIKEIKCDLERSSFKTFQDAMHYSRGGAAPDAAATTHKDHMTTLTLASDEHINTVTASTANYTGWLRVRHVPAGNGAWHPANDNLGGSQSYGDPSDDNNPWSMKFDSIDFDEFRFSTGNRHHFVDYHKDTLRNSHFNCN